MTAKSAATYKPKMSDEAVKAKTGKDWNAWFRTLDKAGAKKLPHSRIAQCLAKEHGVRSWWSQMVTVEYERARGLRETHQTASGYSVSASKTIGVPIAKLYTATTNAVVRKKWFPKGRFVASSATKNKYVNGAWNGARLSVGFYAKGDDKAQIAIQVNKLVSKALVDDERAAWKAALAKLVRVLAS